MILQAKNGPMELSTETIASLRRIWATKDLDTELAKMSVWLERYEKRRPAYFWRFFDTWMRRADDFHAPMPKVAAWWATEQRTLNQGAALGLSARPGESLAEFRERISTKLKGAA